MSGGEKLDAALLVVARVAAELVAAGSVQRAHGSVAVDAELYGELREAVSAWGAATDAFLAAGGAPEGT